MTFPVCSEQPPRSRGRGPARLRRAARARRRAGRRARDAVRDARRVRGRAVRRARHPRRGRAAHRGRHGLQLPADQGRRPRRRREASPQAVKALFATGFFRDVRLEAQGDVLIVVVQERPTISTIDVRRQQGIRHRHAEEGAEGHRHRRGAHLRPLGARPRRAGDEAPVHHARPLRREGHRRRSRRRSATASRSTSRSTKATSSKIARINIVGAKAFTETQLLDQMTLTTPGWLTWYTKNDQYSKQKLAGRPRGAAQLLPEPRLPRVQRRLDAGVDHAGQGRHLHHDQHHRRPALHGGRRRGSPATCRCRRPSSSALVPHAPGETFSRERLQAIGQGDQRPPRHRGLRVRQRQRGARHRPREAQSRRSRSSSTRAGASTCARSTSTATRKTRDEVIRREMRQLEGAWYDGARIERSKVRISRLGYFDDVNIETPPVAGQRRPGRRRGDGHREGHRQPARGRRLLERREASCFNASISQQNIFGTGNALALGINTSTINRTYLGHVHRAVLDRRRRLAHARGLPEEPRPDRRSRSPSTRRRRSAPRSASASRSPRPTRSTSASASSTRSCRCSRTARRSTIDFVSQFGSTHQQRHRRRAAGRVTRATTSSILRRGRLQSVVVEVGLPLGDLAYYKAEVPAAECFWPLYGDFVLMLRGDVGYADGYGGKPLPFFKAFYAGGVGLGARLRDELARPARHRSATRSAASARSSATPSSSTRSSRATSRCAAACSSTPARSAPTARSRSSSRSATPPASASRGTRRSGRSSSATRCRSTRTPGDEIQRFQFQVGHRVLDARASPT